MDKKNVKNQVTVGPKGQPSKTPKQKGENPLRALPITEPCSGSSSPHTTCKNSACKALLNILDGFCKRCTCCICHMYDDNKDPSLWLECSPDSPANSCGFSCHIECALQRGKIDGSYACASCGNISDIIGCWKKQMTIAKECRRVDILCYRLDLSFRLLDGMSRFQDLHELAKQTKSKLETEMGPLGGVSAKLARGLVNRLSVGKEVQAMCDAAIQKADKLSTPTLDARDLSVSMSVLDQLVTPRTSKANASRLALPDLNVDAAQNDPPMDEPDNGNGGSKIWELPASPVANGCESALAYEGGPGNLGQNFVYCLKVIRVLECGKHITPELRRKLVTWFGLKSTAQQRRMVNTFIKTLRDEPSSLASQLVHMFDQSQEMESEG